MHLIANSLIKHEGKTIRPGAKFIVDNSEDAGRFVTQNLAILDPEANDAPEDAPEDEASNAPKPTAEVLEKLTVAELREMASWYKMDLPKSKTKADLVDAILQATTADGDGDGADV